MTNDVDSNWVAQLRQLHDTDKTRRQAETSQQLRIRTQYQKEAELMRHSRAHALLRHVQQTFLDGEGIIKVFENVEGYTLVLVLMWQGPISSARRPDRLEEPYSYISVGVKEGKLWVNGKPLPNVTPKALKAGLLQACKDPQQRLAR